MDLNGRSSCWKTPHCYFCTNTGESSLGSERRASSVASSKRSVSDGAREEDRSGDADGDPKIENPNKNDENMKQDDRESVASSHTSKAQIPPENSQTNDENTDDAVKRDADNSEAVPEANSSSRSSSNSPNSSEIGEKVPNLVNAGESSVENSGEIKQENSTDQEENEKK